METADQFHEISIDLMQSIILVDSLQHIPSKILSGLVSHWKSTIGQQWFRVLNISAKISPCICITMHLKASQAASKCYSGPKSTSLHCYSPLRTTILTEFTLYPRRRTYILALPDVSFPIITLNTRLGTSPWLAVSPREL